MSQLKNILLDHSLSSVDLNVSIARASPETPKNTNDVAKLTTRTKRKSSINSINSIENYINKKYDEMALAQLKQSILSEVRDIVNANISSNTPKTETTYLQKHIDTLMSEIYFLREELKEKNDLIKTFLNKLSKPDIALNETLKEITPSIKKPSTEQSTNDFTDISDTRDIHEENGKKKDEKNLCEGEDATSSKKDDAISIDETLVNSSDNDNANNDAKTDEKSSTGERTQSKEHVAKKKNKVYILGDSMVKHVQGWEINRKLDYQQNVYVRQFSGAKTKCMNDYVKPCTRENDPDHIIFHVGTNDIPSTKTPECIAQSISDLAKSVLSENCNVSVSNIIPRNDQWNNKVREVNDCLARLCKNENISLIDHSRSIVPRKHLNSGKLHLNVRGTNKLRDNFVKYIKDLLS